MRPRIGVTSLPQSCRVAGEHPYGSRVAFPVDVERLAHESKTRRGRKTRWPSTMHAQMSSRQTASEHCLRQCGMKPTVLDQRNPSDLHMLAFSL